MTASINNPIFETYIFSAFFLVFLLLSIRYKKTQELFSLKLTTELKGFSILAIVFSHIGYFFFYDHRFLFPLSILAGVGVNLFLFLSGYGLAVSSLNQPLSPFKFYKKRLIKLFTPLWVIIFIFLLLDFFILKKTYPLDYIIKSFFGFFSSADLYHDLNSPLWYFTLILIYYLIFPLVFSKRFPWISALVIYAFSYLALKLDPAWFNDVMTLYQVHIIAFPLGIFFAWLFYQPYRFSDLLSSKFKNFIDNFSSPDWLIAIRDKFKEKNTLQVLKKRLGILSYYLLLIFFILVFCYLAYYSGVGQGVNKEQLTSIITALLIIIIFILNKFEFRLFYLFGFYSYEIYLLHWPLISRYDVLYKFIPAWLATIVYLILFLGLGWGLQKLSKVITSKIS